MRQYYVYIMASRARTLYVGVTNDLERRAFDHKQGNIEGFTARYKVTKLVHYEATSDVHAEIEREKQLKGWRRSKKVALVETDNPEWKDLALRWYDSTLDT